MLIVLLHEGIFLFDHVRFVAILIGVLTTIPYSLKQYLLQWARSLIVTYLISYV